jgi:hypothetical protein
MISRLQFQEIKMKRATWIVKAMILIIPAILNAGEGVNPILEIENDINDNSTYLIAKESLLFIKCINAETKKATTLALDFGPFGDQEVKVFERNGRKAILLKAVDFVPAKGGKMKIYYLSNGMRDKWESIEINLVRGDKGWNAQY